MTSERSQAYGRVAHTLADLGPTKLLADEQRRVREAADTLLFCEDARDETAVALLGLAVLTLAAQHPAGAARFVVFDALPAGSPPRAFLESVVQPLPHDATLAGVLDVDAMMTDLSAEFARRAVHLSEHPEHADFARALAAEPELQEQGVTIADFGLAGTRQFPRREFSV